MLLDEDIQGVDDTGDVTQDGEQDVNEEVGSASALEEDTDGRQDDGEDDLDDVAAGIIVSLCGRETQRCRALPLCCRVRCARRCGDDLPSGERHFG